MGGEGAGVWRREGGSTGAGATVPGLSLQAEQLRVKVSQPAMQTFRRIYICLLVTLKP